MTPDRERREESAICWMCLQMASPALLILGTMADAASGVGAHDTILAVLILCFLIALAVTTAIYAWALVRMASAKGRTYVWGLAALLGPGGLVLLYAAPARTIPERRGFPVEPLRDLP